jgi:drug/metabolite transporter (DMT)-like permease
VLAVAVAAVSTAAILVRLVPGMHPIAIGFWRTAIVAMLLAPCLVWPSRPRIRPRVLVGSGVAGFCLALHFWAWFASLQYTTVMRSTVLVCLMPVWAGLIAWFTGTDRPHRRFWIGIGVALVGVATMATGSAEIDVGDGGGWLGDALALLGGLLAAVYMTIGRRIRQELTIGPYGALVTGACALWLGLGALITGAQVLPPDSRACLLILAMALGPQLLGHVGFNYAVRYVPAAVVGAVVLLEPVGATALAAVILDEWPGLQEIAGAIGIIAGVAWLSRRPSPE